MQNKDKIKTFKSSKKKTKRVHHWQTYIERILKSVFLGKRNWFLPDGKMKMQEGKSIKKWCMLVNLCDY